MAPLSEDFTKAVQAEQSTDSDKSQQDQDKTEAMEAPYPHPVPSWAVQHAEHFAYTQERTPDAFDQIDAQQVNLSGRFNDDSTAPQENVPDQTSGNDRDGFDRIDDNAAISERFNKHALGRD